MSSAEPVPRVVKTLVNGLSPGEKSLHVSNNIRTTKYTPITFIPRNLFEQFQRIANFYFLVVAILSTIPSISPVSSATNWFPLCFVLGVTALREAYEDWVRSAVHL